MRPLPRFGEIIVTLPKRVFLPVAIASAAVACAQLSPDPPKRVDEGSPWSLPVTRAAALGRTQAAADVTWMRTVQLIGAPGAQARGYPQLEGWADAVTALDPSFEHPYYFATVLLVTDPDRAPKIDMILQRGESALPNQFQLSMYRGFLAHFGHLDLRRAAELYRTAAAKPRAPAFLHALAEKLEQHLGTCGSLLDDLRAFSTTTGGARRHALDAVDAKVFERCTQLRLEQAAAAWRARHDGRAPSLEDLVADGLVEGEPPAPPGRCWRLDDRQKAALTECPAVQAGP